MRRGTRTDRRDARSELVKVRLRKDDGPRLAQFLDLERIVFWIQRSECDRAGGGRKACHIEVVFHDNRYAVKRTSSTFLAALAVQRFGL